MPRDHDLWRAGAAGAQFVHLCEREQEGGGQQRRAASGVIGGALLLQMFDGVARFFATGRAPSR